jgi:hypothetical protein
VSRAWLPACYDSGNRVPQLRGVAIQEDRDEGLVCLLDTFDESFERLGFLPTCIVFCMAILSDVYEHLFGLVTPL